MRCLLQNPRLLILDEPTSVLTPQEAEHLFTTLDKLSAEGCAILYISHKLEEVRRLCRRATILRAGRVVATIDPRERSAREIAALMVGSEVGEVRTGAPHHVRRARCCRVAACRCRRPACTARPCGDRSRRPAPARSSASPALPATGRASCSPPCRASALADRGGRHRHRRASHAGTAGIDARRRLGAAFVPEERLGHAAAPTHRLSENTLISHRGRGR